MRRRSSHVCKDWLGLVGTVALLVSWCGTGAAQTAAPAAQAQPAQMNMADHRGGSAAWSETRAARRSRMRPSPRSTRRTARSSRPPPTRRAPTPSARCRVGKYEITISSAGLTAFRRTGVEIEMDRTATLDITLNAASAAEAAEFERQELLRAHRDARAAHRRARVDHGAVRAGNARPPRRGLRRPERQRARRAGARRQPEVTYQRERVYRRQTISEKIEEALEDADEPQRDGRRGRGHGHAVRAADRGRSRRQQAAPTRWRRPTCSSRPASRRTRSSSPTSSA